MTDTSDIAKQCGFQVSRDGWIYSPLDNYGVGGSINLQLQTFRLACIEEGKKIALSDIAEEAHNMRKSLIALRKSMWSGTDQAQVVDRDYPKIAALVANSNRKSA